MGLHLNVAKTKIMIIGDSNSAPVTIDNEEVEVVNKFNFLGAYIYQTGGCQDEIRRRLAMGRSTMAKLQKIWTDRGVTKATKIKLVHTLIFPIATYACESWTINKADQDRINAFEMWCWRRMLRIPWTAKRTNLSILKEIGTKRLLDKINQYTLSYFGHIARRQGDCLEKVVLQGRIEGSRRPGRPRSRWIDRVMNLVGKPIPVLMQLLIDIRGVPSRESRAVRHDGAVPIIVHNAFTICKADKQHFPTVCISKSRWSYIDALSCLLCME